MGLPLACVEEEIRQRVEIHRASTQWKDGKGHSRLELVPANDLATLLDLCVSQTLSDFRLEPINREGEGERKTASDCGSAQRPR